jgi:hypothetical protein
LRRPSKCLIKPMTYASSRVPWIIEPEIFNGYDPKRKGFTQEIEIQHDLEPIEASEGC